jgi:5-methylcytosine-specific restriction protein A
MMLTALLDRMQGKVPWTARRSPKWKAVRTAFLKGKVCAACGGTRKLEAHHIVPFHVQPELELEVGNLLPLCEAKKYGIACHLFVGHAGSWRRFNPAVSSWAAMVREWVQG